MNRLNKKKVLIDSSKSLKKSNEFSMAKLNHGLTLTQMQLLAYAVLRTQKDGTTEFQKSDFEKMFNAGQYPTAQAKTDSSKVLSVQFSLDNLENDDFEFTNVFKKMRYHKGKFIFVWNEEVVPHILDLKDKYILTDLTITSNFKSGFSWTLYDYLKGAYGNWYKNFSKKAIMKLFGVEKKKSYLKNTALFKASVLDTAIKEINEYTELDVKYEEIKKGRSIVGFKIYWSKGKSVTKASDKQTEVVTSLINTILEDTLMYAEIENTSHRESAISIIRELLQIKNQYLADDSGLTADFCSQLIQQANEALEKLNYYLSSEGKQVLESPYQEENIPLFNWLEQ